MRLGMSLWLLVCLDDGGIVSSEGLGHPTPKKKRRGGRRRRRYIDFDNTK